MIPQRSMRFGLRARAAIGHETAAVGAAANFGGVRLLYAHVAARARALARL